MKANSSFSFQLISVFLILFLILTGCSLPFLAATAEPTQPSTSPQPPTAVPAPQTTAPNFDANSATQFMIAAFENLNKAYPYRLTENTTGASNLDRTTDFAAADRIHSSWMQGGKATETITIGSKTWWKMSGNWSDAPSDTSSPDIYALIAPNLHDVVYAGQETVMNIPCFVFTYGLTIASVNLDGTGKAWIGISDNLPHQLDLDAKVNGMPLNTHLVYSYGVSFDIQQPVP